MVRAVLLGIITMGCVIRLIGLEQSPPGFFYDEATGAAHSVCYQQTGSDLFGQRGIFSKVDFSGFQSMPFLIGGAAWTGVFGIGFAEFRSFIAFVSVLTVVGVYFLARNLTGNREHALWAATLATCMPWAFQFSRISWDAPLGVAFLVWGLVLVYWKSVSSKPDSNDYIRLASAALLLVLASYTYSPLRLHAGLMVLLMPGLHWRPRAWILGLFALGNVAVLMYYRDPEFASRAQLLALNSQDSRNPYRDADFWGLAMAYGKQMLTHFSPQFLLISGDANVRHSIQTHGMLDWVSFAGLLAGIYFAIKTLIQRGTAERSSVTLIALATLGIFAGLTPASLTWDSIPHALRAIGAWPFIALLAAFGLTSAIRRESAKLAVSAIVIVLFANYLYSYFLHYPEISQWWFDVEIIEQIRASGEFPSNYLPVVQSYYRMAEFNESCESVRLSLGVQ